MNDKDVHVVSYKLPREACRTCDKDVTRDGRKEVQSSNLVRVIESVVYMLLQLTLIHPRAGRTTVKGILMNGVRRGTKGGYNMATKKSTCEANKQLRSRREREGKGENVSWYYIEYNVNKERGRCALVDEQDDQFRSSCRGGAGGGSCVWS